jgi:hypothetical protein
MRVLLVLDRSLEAWRPGPAPLDLAAALARRGHAVRLLSVETGPLSEPAARAAGELPEETWRGITLDLPASTTPERRLLGTHDLLRRAIDATLETFHAEVAHAFLAGPAAHAALECGAPYVISTDGFELQSPAAAPLARWRQAAVENASVIAGESETVLAALRTMIDDAEERWQLIPEGWLDPARWWEPGLYDRRGPSVRWTEWLVPTSARKSGPIPALDAGVWAELLGPAPGWARLVTRALSEGADRLNPPMWHVRRVAETMEELYRRAVAARRL